VESESEVRRLEEEIVRLRERIGGLEENILSKNIKIKDYEEEIENFYNSEDKEMKEEGNVNYIC
jgi:predicted  nucleic acid-binding Zn-ribbon protein